jgi:hypothetical protein
MTIEHAELKVPKKKKNALSFSLSSMYCIISLAMYLLMPGLTGTSADWEGALRLENAVESRPLELHDGLLALCGQVREEPTQTQRH